MGQTTNAPMPDAPPRASTTACGWSSCAGELVSEPAREHLAHGGHPGLHQRIRESLLLDARRSTRAIRPRGASTR